MKQHQHSYSNITYLRACPAFFRAFSSPMSHHVPSLSSFKNRPGGSSRRIRRTMSLAMWAFSSLRVLGLRYVDFMLPMMVRNWTLPGWALMRPPRPDRTSLGLGTSMGPMPRGKTSLVGGGIDRVLPPPPPPLGWDGELLAISDEVVLSKINCAVIPRLLPGADAYAGANEGGSEGK